MKKNICFGIVGATGAVGRKILNVLEERGLTFKKLRLFASERSKGLKLPFNRESIDVEFLEEADFKGLDVVFFSAGADISRKYCPEAVKAGAVVIDNSNAFRMDEGVPLIIPEVNSHALKNHKGLIANPNCSTIQMLVAIAPIHRINPIKRIVVTSYQSVSGTGLEAIAALKEQSRAMLEGKKPAPSIYPHPIGFNLFPHIEPFLESGMCREEEKMIRETHKIMESPIPVCPTTVRVPVVFCHSEVVNLELSHAIDIIQIRDLLAKSPGIIVQDDPQKNVYPMPLTCQDRDEVFVGRIRVDSSIKFGINMWVVADNLRRGAATNAVLIHQKLVQENLI